MANTFAPGSKMVLWQKVGRGSLGEEQCFELQLIEEFIIYVALAIRASLEQVRFLGEPFGNSIRSEYNSHRTRRSAI